MVIVDWMVDVNVVVVSMVVVIVEPPDVNVLVTWQGLLIVFVRSVTMVVYPVGYGGCGR